MSSDKNQVLNSYFEIAEQKGWLPKEAIAEPKPLNLAGTGDLSNDVLILIAGLQEKGLDKFAEELANNYVNFKKIETHLYKVHPEKENALLEFAHPEGDAAVCDASGELGTVETLFTAQKKDMHAATNPPMGKLGSSHQVVELVKTALKKKADSDIVLTEPFKKKLTEEYTKYLHNTKFHLEQIVKFNNELSRLGINLLEKIAIKGTYLRIKENIEQLEQAILEQNFIPIHGLIQSLLPSINKLEAALSSDWLSKMFHTDIAKLETAPEMKQIKTELNNVKAQLNIMLGLYQKYETMLIKKENLLEITNTKQEELTKLINFYLTKISDKPNKLALEKWLNEAKQSLVGAKPEVEKEVEEKLTKFKNKWLSQ